ncbi:Pex12 amino terminal region-domain-containing protein, partial [Chytriomyces sp. MP71]
LARLIAALPVLTTDADYALNVFGLRLASSLSSSSPTGTALDPPLSTLQRAAYAIWFGGADSLPAWIVRACEHRFGALSAAIDDDDLARATNPYPADIDADGETNDDGSPDAQRRPRLTAHQARFVLNLFHGLEDALAVASFLNLVAYLWRGRYRTLFERALGIRVVPRNRSVPLANANFEHMNRELVWRALTDFMAYMIPLVNLVRLRRKMVASSVAFGRKIVERLRTGVGGASSTMEGEKEGNKVENAEESNASALKESHEHEEMDSLFLRQETAFDKEENACPICVDAGRWEDVKACGVGTARICAKSGSCDCCVYCDYCLRAALMADSEYSCSVCGVQVKIVERC